MEGRLMRVERRHAPDYAALLGRIHRELESRLGEGRVAAYIPELARVPAERFGMALVTADGRLFTVGDAREKFSIQSVSKVFTLALAIQLVGEALWKRCGREPSGNPFNSLVQLERESGIPRNPFINAGALVVTDIILERLKEARESVLSFLRALSGSADIHFDLKVAASEAATGHRNAAMAHFMKSFGNLKNPAAEVLDAYFHHCSIAMDCVQLAKACQFLANEGQLPATGETVTTPAQTKHLNALMLTCGTYDAVGDFAYRVGLPAKSGVGGGIVAAMPRRFSVCVWAPGLDAQGNSLLGAQALELLTTYSGVSVF
ncbi:MAG TPA: glutaminase [Burkholderiales bacterium]